MRLSLVVLLLSSMPLAAAEPAESIGRGRAQIAAGDCRRAIEVLQGVLPAAVAIASRDERADALGAIHFYTALAFSACEMPEHTREQLCEFFRVKTGKSAIDASKYPAPFIKAFKEVQGAMQDAHWFEALYPGFNEYANFPEDSKSLLLWGTCPEFQILADDAEKSGWGLAREPMAQSEFIQTFWARRDSDPGTERNELREQTRRRVVFADRAFRTPDEERGAFSDRGTVFVLLGPPARVHRQGLKRFETTIATDRSRTPLTGTLERWVYFRPQLPAPIPAQQVEFRFITHPGYGDSVMQKDFMPLKALAEARKAYGKTGQAAE
ncbi:MAG: GWxTD domain-containing protein [Thermoanaerobaculia bacterium]|nr:GWxTD domain-containing protein [Thermoanaerobaculia bacterium]